MGSNSKIKKPFYGITRWLGRKNPELLVRMRYFARFHKPLNLKNPQTLNEKILYLSLKTDTTKWSELADKYQVREFVKEKGLEDILIQSYGVWDKVEDIDFDKLPNQFVLKTTFGSGDCIFVKDKSAADIDEIKAELDQCLHTNYGELEGGKHYYRIPHRIIAEAFIDNDEESAKISSSLIDYKIWCFNGKAHYIWTCCNRDKHGTDVMTYDTDWNAHPEYSIFTPHYREGQVASCPKNLYEMLKIAETLSADFPVVRVDLYNINGKIYFGEMTFTSLGGLMDFYTNDFQIKTGQSIKL